MRLIDRIALNRLLSIISNLIINLAKIFSPKKDDNIKPSPKKPLFPNLRKIIKK
jgi:hypothetical protein